MANAKPARDVPPGDLWAFTEHRTQSDLIADDEVDDGFPYEHVGNEIEMRWSQAGWVTPTPFMVVSLKQLIRALITVYGKNGHVLLRDIGGDLSFIDSMNLSSFLRLQSWVENTLPDEMKGMAGR